MKTSYTIIVIATLTGALALTAFTLPPAVQKAPFADKYWILESSVVSPAVDLDMDGKADTDILAMIEDCEKDDAEMYKTGGTVIKHSGASKCDEEEETVSESGTWEYDAATKQLTVKHHDTRKAQTLTVKELAGNRMVVTTVFTSSKGKHSITAVFKAK